MFVYVVCSFYYWPFYGSGSCIVCSLWGFESAHRRAFRTIDTFLVFFFFFFFFFFVEGGGEGGKGVVFVLNDNVRRFDRLVGEERGGCCAFTNAL